MGQVLTEIQQIVKKMYIFSLTASYGSSDYSTSQAKLSIGHCGSNCLSVMIDEGYHLNIYWLFWLPLSFFYQYVSFFLLLCRNSFYVLNICLLPNASVANSSPVMMVSPFIFISGILFLTEYILICHCCLISYNMMFKVLRMRSFNFWYTFCKLTW